MFQEMQVSSGGGGFPSSDNIKYAYKGSATLTANQTSEFSDAPIYDLNVGDGNMFVLKGQTPFKVYLSATEYYDSVNGMVTYWKDNTVDADTGKPRYYTTVTQQYEVCVVIWENN